jgi:hypothetical protein
MNALPDFVRDNLVWGVALMALTFGVGAAIRWLRADAKRKLADNDPKNDGVAHFEAAAADELEKHGPAGILNFFRRKK